MYSQTEQYTAMVVNMQCEYMSCFACKNQTSKLDKENIEWAIKKEQSRETGNIWYIRRRKTKQKHNMCWTPLCAHKHK
jgi:hypothetical protein